MCLWESFIDNNNNNDNDNNNADDMMIKTYEIFETSRELMANN